MIWLVWKDGMVEERDLDIIGNRPDLVIPVPRRSHSMVGYSADARLPSASRGGYETRRFSLMTFAHPHTASPIYVEEGTPREAFKKGLMELNRRILPPPETVVPEDNDNGDEVFTVPDIEREVGHG